MNRSSLSAMTAAIASAMTAVITCVSSARGFTARIRVLSLSVLLVLFWYIMVAPSLKLNRTDSSPEIECSDPKAQFDAYWRNLNNGEEQRKDDVQELANQAKELARK